MTPQEIEQSLLMVRTHERLLSNDTLSWIQIQAISPYDFITVGISNRRSDGTFAGFTMDGTFCCSGTDWQKVNQETHVNELARTAQLRKEQDAAKEEQQIRNEA